MDLPCRAVSNRMPIIVERQEGERFWCMFPDGQRKWVERDDINFVEPNFGRRQ